MALTSRSFEDEGVLESLPYVRRALRDLELGQSVRRGRIIPEHVRALAEVVAEWPPITITRHGRIVDGNHRYLAAKRVGLREVRCRIFDGDDTDLFLEAVRCNATHGLPLTLDERRSAARRILELKTDWSDRRIAALCGLAHETVGRLRKRLCLSGEISNLERRVGRDGRVQLARSAVVALDGTHGSGSLHHLVVSPSETRQTSVVRSSHDEGAMSGPRVCEPSTDAAFISTEQGSLFAGWFAHTAIADDWSDHVRAVPLSRTYEVIDEARRRAAAWDSFAAALASRVSNRAARR